jgi:hypothetical protein
MKSQNPQDRLMFDCDVCDRPYQHGRHVYEGKPLSAAYGHSFVCPICYEGNHDGWHPSLEPAVLALLERKGLPVPPRLPNGLLPR